MSHIFKICGWTDEENLKRVLDHCPYVTHIGLNFFPGSSRYVSYEKAQILCSIIKKHSTSKIVGLFVNEPLENIKNILTSLPLDIIQLSGDERCEDTQNLSKTLEVWKTIHIGNQDDFEKAQQFEPYARILCDIKDPKYYGGTGISLSDLCLEYFQSYAKKYILAGGIRAENIEHILDLSHAHHIDIASGAEDCPGIKNQKKIETLFHCLTNFHDERPPHQTNSCTSCEFV